MSGEGVPARSKRYSAVKTRLFLADIVLTVVLLLVFQLFLAGPVSKAASGICPNFYAACFIFASVFLLYMYVLSFPLRITGSFFVERHFGLSRQSFISWAADEIKSAALSFILSIGCILVFYYVLRNFPVFWWIITACLWIFFSVVLARFLPVFLIPLFYKYSPIEDPELKERIMSLADKTDISLMDVCQIDLSRKTAKANAALVGLGKTRKVILADTLLDDFTPDEVESVVAHEFAHYKYRHIWQLLAFSGVVTLTGFFMLSLIADRVVVLSGASGLSDMYLLPVLIFLLALFGIVLLPVQNLFSRVLERQADRFALDMTGKPKDFIAVMEKLAAMNLADVSPSRLKKIFLYNHPPISERIHMAREKL